MTTLRNTRNSFLILCSGAVIMMLLAFFDNYPIVNGDSGTYIRAAFNGEIPTDRPVFYSWFIRLSCLGKSFWLTVFWQSFLLSFLLLRLMRQFVPDISNAHIVSFFLLISIGTIGGWYSSQLTPDIFTPILVLALILYLIDNSRKRYSFLYLLLVTAAALMHNAHPIILTLFTLSLLLWLLFKRSTAVSLKKAGVLAGLSITSWLLFCIVNFNAGYGFRPSKVTPIFLVGKLSESGILKTYLDVKCNVKDYKICPYKDSLPPTAFNFVWDGTSPLHKTGGWDANLEEYNYIVKDIAGSPKYYPLMVCKSLEATARQLTQINIDGSYILPWTVFDETTAPYQAIANFMPHELNEFRGSRQNEKTLSISFYDKVYALVFILSTLCVLLCYNKLPPHSGILYTLLFLLLFLNAFSTATFANVLPRLNSRVIWLLPACNLLMIYTILKDSLFPCRNLAENHNP